MAGGGAADGDVRSLREEVKELKEMLSKLVTGSSIEPERSGRLPERKSSGISMWSDNENEIEIDDPAYVHHPIHDGVSLPSTERDFSLEQHYNEVGVVSPQRPESLRLRLPVSPLSPKGVVGLVESSLRSNRRVLNMYGKGMGDDIDHILRQATGCGDCQIQEIDIGKNKLTATSDLSGLSAFSSCENIEVLRVNGNPEVNLESLLLSMPPNLRVLELGDCGLTENSVAALCGFLPNFPNLGHLSLYCNPLIGDGGASHLAQAVARGHTFDHLDLQDCGISPAARKWLRSGGIAAQF